MVGSGSADARVQVNRTAIARPALTATTPATSGGAFRTMGRSLSSARSARADDLGGEPREGGADRQPRRGDARSTLRGQLELEDVELGIEGIRYQGPRQQLGARRRDLLFACEDPGDV